MLVGFITVPAVILVFAARVYSVASLAAASAMVALSAAAATLAFDSLLQRDAHDADARSRDRALRDPVPAVWVGGGLLAVVLAPTHDVPHVRRQVRTVPDGVVMLFVGFGYLGAVRHADRARARPTNRRQPEDPRGSRLDTGAAPRDEALSRDRARCARARGPGPRARSRWGACASRSHSRLSPSMPARSMTPSQNARPLS